MDRSPNLTSALRHPLALLPLPCDAPVGDVPTGLPPWDPGTPSVEAEEGPPAPGTDVGAAALPPGGGGARLQKQDTLPAEPAVRPGPAPASGGPDAQGPETLGPWAKHRDRKSLNNVSPSVTGSAQVHDGKESVPPGDAHGRQQTHSGDRARRPRGPGRGPRVGDLGARRRAVLGVFEGPHPRLGNGKIPSLSRTGVTQACHPGHSIRAGRKSKLPNAGQA